MPLERPTFSEHWHRVANLRPRLRALVQSFRQQYRGQTWHVLRDPSNNKFMRLDDAGYRFVGMLDGRRTVDEVWRACFELLGEAAPTQNEAVRLLGQLYTSNLLAGDLPADAEGMFKRQRKRVRREVGQYLMSLLFARVPIWDPDRFLSRWVSLVGWCFGPVGIALWLVLMYFGLSALAGKSEQLLNQFNGVLSPDNLLWLYVAMVIVKLVHELGHGFCCRHFGRREGGGEVHTLGIMLLVFMPVPYVDASSAWAFRSKWKRIFVSSAGMYAELAVAAIAAMVWARTASGTTTHALAYNMIFVAGVSTLLFNLNPLIKFDGYFILSDLTDTPNLMQRSKEMLYYYVKRFAYGVPHPRRPSHSRVESFWLVVYAIASSIYRVFLSVTILLFVADKLFFIGAIMGAMGLVGWVIVPVGKFIHYLAVGPELMRTRTRALLVTVTTLALLLGGLGLIPVPDHGRAEGIIEPQRIQIVHAGADGFVREAMPPGSAVQMDSGTPLFIAENRELLAQSARLRAQLASLTAQHRQKHGEEPAEAQAIEQQISATQEQLSRIEDDLQALTPAAPFDGVWVHGELDPSSLNPGSYIKRGQAIGYIATLDDLRIRVAADQYLGPKLPKAMRLGETVEIRGRMRPNEEFEGRIVRLIEGGHRVLPSASLGYSGGGALAVDPESQTGDRTAEPFFEVDIEFPKEELIVSHLLSGERVVVRFKLPDAPLLVQGWRMVREVLQERFSI